MSFGKKYILFVKKYVVLGKTCLKYLFIKNHNRSNENKWHKNIDMISTDFYKTLEYWTVLKLIRGNAYETLLNILNAEY